MGGSHLFPAPPTYRKEPSWPGSAPTGLTLGSHHGLGERQGSYISYGRLGELPEGWGTERAKWGRGKAPSRPFP